MMKYGIIELLGKKEEKGNMLGHDIAEYQGNIYRILICDDTIHALTEPFRKKGKIKSRLNGRVARCKADLVDGIYAFQILGIIKRVISEQEHERVKTYREDGKENSVGELKEWLAQQGICSAIDLLYFSGRHLRGKGSSIGTILGRGVRDIGVQEKQDICKEFGWDLHKEIKELLRTKAGIVSVLGLMDCGHNKFVSIFGLKLISLINGYYNRAVLPDIILFGQRLGRNLIEEVKILLRGENISCGLDMMRISRSVLLKYKEYLGTIMQRDFNSIVLQDRVDMCKTFGRDIPQEIVDRIDDDKKPGLYRKIKELGLHKNTSFVLNIYGKELHDLLGYHIEKELALDLEIELKKKFRVQTSEEYYQKITTKILRDKIGLQRMGLILGKSLKDITYYEKCELIEKMGWNGGVK